MKSVVRFVVRCFIAVLLLPILACVIIAHSMVVVFEFLAKAAQKLEDLLVKLANKYCDYWGPIFRGGKK